METSLIICGSGGQGILLSGILLAHASTLENKNVTWLPSYGAEKRGGLSYCAVVISDEEIASPFVDKASAVLALDNIGLNVYESYTAEKGLIVVNSSLIKREIKKKNIDVLKVPFNDIANEIGNTRVLNMVALGVYIGRTKVLKLDSLIDSLQKVISSKYRDLIEINKKALERGTELTRGRSS